MTFRNLFVFVVLHHGSRQILHVGVTAHPTVEWTALQLMESLGDEEVPELTHLIRDRDGIYGDYFKNRVKGMGIDEVLIAPSSPWQSPYVERIIGSIRRECLDHFIA